MQIIHFSEKEKTTFENIQEFQPICLYKVPTCNDYNVNFSENALYHIHVYVTRIVIASSC